MNQIITPKSQTLYFKKMQNSENFGTKFRNQISELNYGTKFFEHQNTDLLLHWIRVNSRRLSNPRFNLRYCIRRTYMCKYISNYIPLGHAMRVCDREFINVVHNCNSSCSCNLPFYALKHVFLPFYNSPEPTFFNLQYDYIFGLVYLSLNSFTSGRLNN